MSCFVFNCICISIYVPLTLASELSDEKSISIGIFGA